MRRHHATLDRLGWALMVEPAAGGLAAALSAAIGGAVPHPLALALAAAFAGGALVTLLVTVVLGLPLWAAVRRRAEGPLAATLLGGAIGWLLLVAAQIGDGTGGGWRWLSAAAVATILLPLPMLLALLCWYVAYLSLAHR